MVTTQYLTDQIIVDKLAEAEKEAENPNTAWLSHDEVFGNIWNQAVSSNASQNR